MAIAKNKHHVNPLGVEKAPSWGSTVTMKTIVMVVISQLLGVLICGPFLIEVLFGKASFSDGPIVLWVIYAVAGICLPIFVWFERINYRNSRLWKLIKGGKVVKISYTRGSEFHNSTRILKTTISFLHNSSLTIDQAIDDPTIDQAIDVKPGSCVRVLENLSKKKTRIVLIDIDV